jgi:hypothetical protein
MKKSVLSLLFLPVFAVAQQTQPQESVTVNKPVICVQTEVLMSTLEKSEYQEIPYWMGTDSNSYWALVVNEKTGTWTMIQFTQDVGCIVGAGSNSGTVLQPQK